ncbi:MAG: copper oxidase [Methylobacter sp.]|nr:MAG: copper oxidase [Methylobacter sp.]PPD17680.1 MAG: copper oxidase [Methylobacter sp.]PPD36139.1 MAG: copper oxidase [Methylomonas sp.]
MFRLFSMAALWVFLVSSGKAVEIQEHNSLMSHGHESHLMDMDGGMVMGQNTATLPGGCDRISETKEITVHAGHKYSEKFPGTMFAFDTQEFNFKPCTKLTVHFINEDNIRHQWMMHGLPKYLYPQGMFHLEITGPAKISGTLILPPGDKTYLVHCDIAQHMEKGMKAQLKVGKGDGDLPSIPGVTANAIADDYSSVKSVLAANDAAASVAQKVAADKAAAAAKKLNPEPAAESQGSNLLSGGTVIGLVIGLILAPLLARKFKGMSASEIIAYIFELLRAGLDFLMSLVKKLIKLISAGKTKTLPGN